MTTPACLLLIALLAPATLAASLSVPGFTGSEGHSQKQVASLREARFAHVVEQKSDFSCGAAALATLLRYAFDRDVDEQSVIDGMLKSSDAEQVRQQGFSLLDIKRHVQSLGLRASGFNVDSSMLLTMRVPVIAMLDVKGYKHFVVLRAAIGDTVYVADPSVGNRSIPLDTFRQQWNGILLAVAGPGYRLDNPLRRISRPLSARDSVNGAEPVKIADLVEYGFLYSDFF